MAAVVLCALSQVQDVHLLDVRPDFQGCDERFLSPGHELVIGRLQLRIGELAHVVSGCRVVDAVAVEQVGDGVRVGGL